MKLALFILVIAAAAAAVFCPVGLDKADCNAYEVYYKSYESSHLWTYSGNIERETLQRLHDVKAQVARINVLNTYASNNATTIGFEALLWQMCLMLNMTR